MSHTFTLPFLMNNLCPRSVFRPSHRSRMRCRCPCKSPAHQIDGAACPCASQGWRTATLHGCINCPLQTCGWCLPLRGLPGAWVGAPGTIRTEPLHGGDGLAACPFGMTPVSRTGANCHNPMALFRLPQLKNSGQTTSGQLPYPNCHIQTATSHWLCSNHPIRMAVSHLSNCYTPMAMFKPTTANAATALFRPPCSNHHIQITMDQLPPFVTMS